MFLLIVCRKKVNKSLSDRGHLTLKRHLLLRHSGFKALSHKTTWCCDSCMLNYFNTVQLFVKLRTVAHQDILSTGILQARILECMAMPSSRGSSPPRDQTCVSYASCTGRQVPYHQHHLGRCCDKHR